MEEVHKKNAAELSAIIDEHGWPGVELVGEEAAKAAWLVATHAISLPDFQRRCRAMLAESVERGDAPAAHLAMLDDRIRFNEGRPQRYGTILDWQDDGDLGTGPIEDPDRIEERRAEVGLPSLNEHLERVRAATREENNTPPDDIDARRREIDEWARNVGWR
jgi:hypothetical protein